MRRSLAAALLALLAAAAPAAASGVTGYDGANPFRCEVQRVGSGVDFPRPEADPFCVEYDKTHQNVTELGVVDFLSKEPARVAAGSDKCFYHQADHWRGSVEQSYEQSETYNWDGSYFFDKARGVAATYVENFTVNNASFDPRSLPGFPAEWRPFFGWGRGGIQMTSIAVDPACAARAEREQIYRSSDADPPAGREARRPAGYPRLALRVRQRSGRTRSGRRCARSAVRLRIAGRDRRAVRRAEFRLDGRRLGVDRRAPFTALVRRGQVERRSARRVRVVAELADGRRWTGWTTIRRCGERKRR